VGLSPFQLQHASEKTHGAMGTLDTCYLPALSSTRYFRRTWAVLYVMLCNSEQLLYKALTLLKHFCKVLVRKQQDEFESKIFLGLRV